MAEPRDRTDPVASDDALGARVAALYPNTPAPRPTQAAECAAAVLARAAAGERPIDLPAARRHAPFKPQWWWGAAAAAVLLIAVTARTGRFNPGAHDRDSLPPVTEVGAAPVESVGVSAGSASGMDSVRFEIAVPPGAGGVSVVGDFNGWDAEATPMQREAATGAWTVEVPLTPGRHVYAFVIDGTRWVVDPLAPQVPDAGFGPANAVVVDRRAPGGSE
jgi:hypothetical protein